MAFDPYTSDADASKLGLLGPTIMKGARALHARQLAKSMMMGDFKHGGKVPKTGMYKLHKGETVVPTGKNKVKTNKNCSAAMTE